MNGSRIRAACTVLALGLVCAPSWASGFSIYEQSAKASGQAGAWIARADDAAANWYNPASLTRLEGRQLQFGTNLITIGSDTDLIADDPAFGVTSPTRFSMQRNNSFPSHFYFTQKVSEKWAWGVGLNTPYGLVTEWSALPVTLASQKAELVTFVLNPNVAYAVNDRWSLALGVDYMYADVGEFSRVPDQSALLGMAPLSVLGESNLTGDGDDFGFNVAAHFSGERFRFGFTYRAAMSPEIEGNVRFGGINPAVAALFPDGPGKATIDLPAQAGIGLSWNGGEDWTFEVDLGWAGWSSFEQLLIDFENETSVMGVPVVEDTLLRDDWDDTLSYRFGAAWRAAERHEFRFGGIFDEAGVPEDTLRPSIPDADRTALTLGYGFLGERWTIDAYYMPLWFDDITASGSAAEGVLDGEYQSSVHLFGVTFNLRF